MNAQEKDTPALVSKYVLTCNAALDRHENEFPYQQILTVCRKVFAERRIGVEIYNEQKPQSCCDYYTLGLRDGRLHLLTRGKLDPDFQTRLSREYLQKVAEDAERYIEDPSELDMAGLKSQFIL